MSRKMNSEYSQSVTAEVTVSVCFGPSLCWQGISTCLVLHFFLSFQQERSNVVTAVTNAMST
jgi:hypothetical protein